MKTNRKIQAVVYKKNNFNYEFLVLKYSEKKGGFYQNVTGSIEDTDKSTFDALIRELDEELSLKKQDIITLLPEIYSFDFGQKKKLHETVFGIEVSPYFNPIISDEHELFKWLNFNDAINLLEFESNKESLRKVKELLPK